MSPQDSQETQNQPTPFLQDLELRDAAVHQIKIMLMGRDSSLSDEVAQTEAEKIFEEHKEANQHEVRGRVQQYLT